jgi:glycosyltransferase involved in cell wall biosynthesis
MTTGWLRIWHVNIGNHAGRVDGVAVVADQLARDQAALGHEVQLIVAAAEARRRLGPGADRPDVIHLHSVFRPAHRMLAWRAKQLGIPVVLSPHSGLAPALLRRDRLRKGLYGAVLERRFYRSADGVHALQLVERDDVRRYCASDRAVAVIANPVDPALLRAEPWPGESRPGSRPRVVLLCRYDVYQKGLDRLDAMARLLPDVDFDVHGHSDKNAPEQAAALIAEAPGNLRFKPPVHGNDKLAVLRGADLFLQPSRVEGLSVALAEAMTLGVPCAVSGYVGRSLDLDRLGAALVLDDAPDRAAAQLAALLSDRPRRGQMGAAARAHAVHEFDPEAVARRHIEHYTQLLDHGVPTTVG